MSSAFNIMGDKISTLPVEDKPLSYKEQMIIEQLYGPDGQVVGATKQEGSDVHGPSKLVLLRSAFIVSILFVILNMPLIDKVLSKLLSEKPYFKLGLKTLIFFVIILALFYLKAV